MPRRYGIHEAAQYAYGHRMYRTSQSSGSRSPRPPTSFEREPSRFTLYLKLFLAIFTMLLGAILALCINVFDRRSFNVTRSSYKPITSAMVEISTMSTTSEATTTSRMSMSYFFQLNLTRNNPLPYCLNCGTREDLGKDMKLSVCRPHGMGQLFHYSRQQKTLWTILKKGDKDEYCLKIKPKTRSVILVDCGEENLASFPTVLSFYKLRDNQSGLCIKGKFTGEVKAVLCNNTEYSKLEVLSMNTDSNS